MGFSSATGLVEAGYKGDSVESIVRTLLDRAGGDPKEAEKGIVFIWNAVEQIKRDDLDWAHATPSAQTWWQTFEKDNHHRPALILRLVEELQRRKAAINDFFLAYVYSNTDNIQANLHYLDYSRLKKQSEGA